MFRRVRNEKRAVRMGRGQGEGEEGVMKRSDRELDLEQKRERGRSEEEAAEGDAFGGEEENERSLRAFVFEFYSRR